jgi:hypothetical protein
MKPYLLIGLLLLSACGSKKSPVEYGKTTRADIIALKHGTPHTETKVPVEDGSVMIYPDETFQLKGDIVTNVIRQPQGDEATLIYWKHRFKDCHTKQEVLPHPKDSHIPPDVQLSCEQQGEAVIYMMGSDAVKKVMGHEPK